VRRGGLGAPRPKHTVTIAPGSPNNDEIDPADLDTRTNGASFKLGNRAKIKWRLKGASAKGFGIVFKGKTTFVEMGFHEPAGGSGFRTVIGDADNYPYSVVAYNGAPILDDPEIIIVDGGP